jgi:hypothetical protein
MKSYSFLLLFLTTNTFRGHSNCLREITKFFALLNGPVPSPEELLPVCFFSPLLS